MEREKAFSKREYIFYCECCNFTTSVKFSFDRHNLSLKHFSKLNNIEKPKKVEKNYNCFCCDFTTIVKKDFNRHSLTRKHLKNIKPKEPEKEIEETIVAVNTVDVSENILNTVSNPTVTTLIMELMKRQDFLQNTIIELAKNQSIANSTVTTNSHNNSTVTKNSNNQQFNLQFFLNETCKDAMNIDDFVNSLNIGLEDFENTGNVGYIEGITRIIVNGLNQVDTTERPIHCTDVKRETVYIKSEDSWEKENQEKEKMKKAVKQVARMNLSQLPRWQRENPASEILDTKEHCQYMKYSLAALGGLGEKAEEQNIDKIMRNVMKEVIVNKK